METIKEILTSEEFISLVSSFVVAVIVYLIKSLKNKSKLLEIIIQAIENSQSSEVKKEVKKLSTESNIEKSMNSIVQKIVK